MANIVLLTGRIGKDPETKTFDNGVKVTFPLATEESYKADGEWKKVTDWHNISMSRETRLKKGDLVSVQGKLKTRKFSKNGADHYFTEVSAYRVELEHRIKNESRVKDVADAPEDDLPFIITVLIGVGSMVSLMI